MNGGSPPLTSAKKKRRTNAPDQRAAAAAATAAIRAMQDFDPHHTMSDKKENFMPRNIPQFSDDNNLVASNPFDDHPQRSFDIPTGPPQFIANPTPRRGITPDQIGNMNYLGMRRMQQANQAMAAMNPMASVPNRFDHPPNMAVVNPVNNMRSNNMGQMGNVNNMGMQGNMNQNLHHHHYHHHSHMMNTQMGGAPMNGNGMTNGSPMNGSGVGGLAMNGSTMINQMAGLIGDSRASPVNQMMGSRASPVNQMMGSRASPANQMMGSRASPVNQMMNNRASPVNPMMNIPVVSPLMSPNHMNSALNMPPMNHMNGTHPQQHFNQMNNSRGSMQRPPNMSMPGMNPMAPVSIMDSNNQMNNMHMTRPYNNRAPDMNMMNGNSYMGHSMQNAMPGKQSAPGMNMGMSMPPPNLPIDSKPMGMPGSDDKIFPPNQPMMFNHQHPYEPPISPCGICRREVQATDQAVFCESGCNFWFHRRCAGLTEAAYEMLMQEPYAEWVCDKCITSKDIPLVKYKA